MQSPHKDFNETVRQATDHIRNAALEAVRLMLGSWEGETFFENTRTCYSLSWGLHTRTDEGDQAFTLSARDGDFVVLCAPLPGTLETLLRDIDKPLSLIVKTAGVRSNRQFISGDISAAKWGKKEALEAMRDVATECDPTRADCDEVLNKLFACMVDVLLDPMTEKRPGGSFRGHIREVRRVAIGPYVPAAAPPICQAGSHILEDGERTERLYRELDRIRKWCQGQRNTSEESCKAHFPELTLWPEINNSPISLETRKEFFNNRHPASARQETITNFIGKVIGIPGSTAYDYRKKWRKANGISRKRRKTTSLLSNS